MRTVYRSPRSDTNVIVDDRYIPLDRKDGENWRQDLAGAQDQRLAQDIQADGKTHKPDMGYWELSPSVRRIDVPAFLHGTPLVPSVAAEWGTNAYSLGQIPFSATWISRDGPKISAFEDLVAYKTAEGANQAEWTQAITKRDQFRQNNKEIFNIYHHCYTLHVLLDALESGRQEYTRLCEENNALFCNAAKKYVKHPLAIAYFLACTAGIVAFGYMAFEQILDFSVEREIAERAAIGILCIFALSMLAGLIGVGGYCWAVELSLFNQRASIGNDIQALRDNISLASLDLRSMVDGDKVIQPVRGNEALYANIAPSYMRIQQTALFAGTITGVNNAIHNSSGILNTAITTEQNPVTITKAALQNMAETIDTEMRRRDYALPAVAV